MIDVGSAFGMAPALAAHPTRVVTVSTTSFRPTLERLITSLGRVHPEASLDVYVDHGEQFAALQSDRVTVRVLPEIVRLGVKRAKFWMYCDAIASGSFVYLDADVVVLDRLDDLWPDTGLIATHDGLEACRFIPEPRFPWPGDPELRNDRYINSGVMGFGADTSQFLEFARGLAGDDEFWDAHVVPEHLYDNHVLCAALNLSDVPLRLLPNDRFNWQGFLDADGGVIASLSDDGHLVNPGGERLALVHFAGVGDVDRFLLDVDFTIAGAVNAASVEPLAASRAAAAVSAGAALTLSHDADPHRAVAAGVVTREFVRAWEPGLSSADTYVGDIDSVASVALAVPPQPVLWNGLLCGGAYLEPSEYAFLRACASAVRGSTTVELGAGESSLILSELADRCISIDPNDGPWLERAVAAGVDAHHIPLDDGRFEAAAFESVLADCGPIDLLFVDSPNGTQRRRSVLRQVLERTTPRHVIMHDARRDAFGLLTELAGLGFVVSAAHTSRRGMLVLSQHGSEPLRPPPLHDGGAVTQPRVVLDGPDQIATGSPHVALRIENSGESTWPCDGDRPVRVSYHLAGPHELAVFDGARTELPCDMLPGDELELPVRIDWTQALDAAHVSEVLVTLVQEHVGWFDVDDTNVHRIAVT
jgi:hypothetical protein